MPVGSPYCSDPNCVYCKELHELEEEIRRKSRLEGIEPTGESESSVDSWLGGKMDNVSLIRVVAGILAGVVLVILILRMKKKAPR